MAQSILCPQCEKRFRLSDNPPAQATCSGCGTLMDLTAFGGGGAQPAAAPEAPKTTSTPKPTQHRASRAGAKRRRAPASRRGARRGPPARGEAPQEKPMSGGTQAILIFVGVLIVVLLFVVAGKRDADDIPKAPAPPPVAEVDPTPSSIPYSPEPIADPSKRTKKDTRKRKVPLNRKGKPRLSRVQLVQHDWPDEVPADVRAQADEAIRKMYVGGRDGVEAADWMVSQGRPIAGRLISEFLVIEASPGFDDRNGAAMAMVIDGTLRRIDGQIERYWEERERIRAWGAYAAPSFITRIAKRWTWWWIEGEWKENPRKPWDPFEDEDDAAKDGIKRTEPDKKKDPKKTGYGKRAGSD